MGGGDEDTFSSHDSPSDGELLSDQYFPQTLPRKAEEETVFQDDELMGGSDDEQTPVFPQFQAKWRRDRAFREVLKCYDDLQVRIEDIAELKTKIRSYSPGTWVEEVVGLKSSDYQFPQTTCLLIIGPKGSGKSSLVNKISRIFEDDKFAPDRAQISYSCRDGDGTCFLREYMIPRSSNAFCLYDTRGLSDCHTDNAEKIKLWMTKGVGHGELLIRGSDGPFVRKRMKSKARSNHHQSIVKRNVNFVVFVVDGLSVLESIEGTKSDETDLITRTYDLPYLSFNDDKPVVVVTHGDLLSIEGRARVRVHLGKLLGIHPTKQVFDIPDISDQATELAILEMLRYSLEHADRSLPRKTLSSNKVTKMSILKALCFCLIQLLLGITVVVFLLRSAAAYRHQPRTTHSEVHDRPQTANSAHHDQPQTGHSLADEHTWKTISDHHHRRPQKEHSDHRCRPKNKHKVVCDRPETADCRRFEKNTEEIHIDWSKIRHMWLG